MMRLSQELGMFSMLGPPRVPGAHVDGAGGALASVSRTSSQSC